MAKFNNTRLIKADGSIDLPYLARSAAARAKSQYGASCTSSDVAFWTGKLTVIAQGLRAQRFPEPATCTVSPFGRQVEGVRRSAF